MNEDKILDLNKLMEQMTTPDNEITKIVSKMDDIMILGVGGKMGPTLAELIARAGGHVVGVDIFPDEEIRNNLEAKGVRTIKCDLFDNAQLSKLPTIQNIFLLAGTKFGATGNEPFVWAMNSYLPGKVLERFKKSRIVYLSSGNVYKFIDVNSGGATEEDEVAPVGEYAMSRLGGERILAYEAKRNNIPCCIVRLFYSTELRYGIVHDIANKIKNGDVIDLSMGYVNQIWQGDACSYLVKCLSLCEVPVNVINLTSQEIYRVRDIAEKLGNRMNMEPVFKGKECENALLGNPKKLVNMFGEPKIDIDQIIEWVADWVMNAGESLGKPTKFEKRNGKF